MHDGSVRTSLASSGRRAGSSCRWLVPLLVGLAVATACSPGHEVTIGPPSTGGPIRLVDVLPLAQIQGLPAAALDGERAEPRFESVWSWSPGPDPRVDWREGACHLETADDGSPELRCSPDSAFRTRADADQAGLYRFRVRVGTEELQQCFRFYWVEGERSLRRASRLDEQEGEVVYEIETYLSGDSPASLELQDTRLGRDCLLAIRSVEVDRADMTPGDLLARIRKLTPLAGSGHPLAVAGYLLPRRPAETLRPPFDEIHSYREAILAPPGQRLVFPLKLPPSARLSLSLALHQMSAPGAEVGFSVRIESGRRSRTLLEESLTAAHHAWHWHERRFDLGEASGGTVRLVLETTVTGDSVALPLWGAPRVDFPRSSGDPPSVLMLAVDTLRADRLGPYGSDGPPTPAIDRLAEEGIVFDQAIAEANWTLPSFASLLTGASPARHRMLRPLDPLSRRFPTVAEDFRTGGWVTDAILFKGMLAAGRDLERGFERYFNPPLVYQRADRNLGKALEWLKDHGDRRFFLFLHFDDPHLPFTQPDRWVAPTTLASLERLGLSLPLARSEGELMRLCRPCRESLEARLEFEDATRSLYDGEIAYLDDQLGLLFGELRRLGVWDELLIVFVSDHGELLWQSPAPNAVPRYGHHGDHHPDDLVRVPLIFKLPASWGGERGTRAHQPIQLVDVAATLAELAGRSADNGTPDGRSFLGLLRGKAREVPTPRPQISLGLHSESLRWGLWHYFRRYLSSQEIVEWVMPIEGESGASDATAPPLDELRARMADHLATTGAGWVVLAVRANPGGELAVTMRTQGACDDRAMAFPPYGLSWQCRNGAWRAQGRADSRLPVVFGLPIEGDEGLAVQALVDGAELSVRARRVGELPDYRPGKLVEWVATGEVPELLVARVAAAPKTVDAPTGTGVDDAQIEVLRALGYLN